MNITVLDDVIPKSYQDYLEEFLLNNKNMSWNMVRNLASNKDSKELGSVGFSIQCISNGEDHGMLAFVLRGLCHSIADKFNHKFSEIFVARAFLQTPNGTPPKNRMFHIDHPKPHWVLLYYVNDSEGPTIITKERYPFSSNSLTGIAKAETLMEVEPKKGRAVLFHGSHFHDSSVPSKNLRCVINFNLI